MDILISKLSNLVGLSVDKIMEAYPKLARQVVIYKINSELQFFLFLILVALIICTGIFFVAMDASTRDSLTEWRENPGFRAAAFRWVKRIAFVMVFSFICSSLTFILTPDLQVLRLLLK